MRWRTSGWILALLLAGRALAGPPAGGSSESAEGSWLSRLFDRHLRTQALTGEELGGRALEAVDAYQEFAGRTIEVVLVSQVARFDRDWRSTRGAPERLLGSLTDPLQSYTRDGTIRQQLLFRRGDSLDPFVLADTERLLRRLPYISDVRITVVPLLRGAETVAVVVETRDRWPLGLDGRIVDRKQFSANVYTVNLLGWGVGLDHEILYREDADPSTGHRTVLTQPNLFGTFIGGQAELEDSWRQERLGVALERRLWHPDIDFVGGARAALTDDRDNGGVPREFLDGEIWVGRAARLGEGGGRGDSSRPLLVPAAGLWFRSFDARPEVTVERNRTYHDRRLLLGGLTYQRVKYYRTSFLYRMGETEDVLSGLTVKGVMGYESGQFQERTCGWLEAALLSIRNRGDLVFLRVGSGGFLRRGDFEEGIVTASAGYAGPLMGDGRYRGRLHLQAAYALGIDRYPEEDLSLGDRTGLRGFPDEILTGDQRLVGSLEGRLFTPWTFLGFRCMLLGFADAGLIGGEDDPILDGRIHLSGGLGLRLHNPGLVFPPVQVRVGVESRLDGHGLIVGLAMGDADRPGPFGMPGVRPTPIPYE
ncbi:MAG: hypothetical protein AB7V45_10180 [Candidatus Krumholzibacteriia bacterium]